MVKVLELAGVNKSFGKFQALKDVTFSIEEGEVFGFLGPNGAGKSTAIRTILGLLKRDSGKIELMGEDATSNVLESHKKIAYVPGDVFLWPNLTGGETIDLLLRLGGHERSKYTDELIKKFELDPKKKARTYSKGNRQKVALIAAFSADVDLYIFDEPTSGLDPLQERNFQEEVLKLKAAGKTVLLSSHILSEVEKMVDRVAIIRTGEIVKVGALTEMQELSAVNVRAVITDPEVVAGFEALDNFMQQNAKISFTVTHEQLPSVLAELAQAQVHDVQITPPTLEDMFMQFYLDNGVAANDQK